MDKVIENSVNIGNDGQKTQEPTRVARGRKPVTESRALELRQHLVRWQRLPEPSRPSLRALARELGTSHQLLKHYLDGIEEWEFENRFLAAKEIAQRKATEVRSRAKAQNREMTKRECCEAIVFPCWFRQLESIMKDFKRGPLYYDQIKILKIIARNFPLAQEFLQKCSQQKAVRRPTPEEAHPELRICRLTSKVEKMGGILWLDDEGRVAYFIPSMDSNGRDLMAKIWKHREEVKRFLGDQMTRLKGQGRYEEIKAKICQHFPPERLSPLDEFKDTGSMGGNSARTSMKEGDEKCLHSIGPTHALTRTIAQCATCRKQRRARITIRRGRGAARKNRI